MKQVEKIIILLLSFVIFSCSESTKKNGVVVSGKIQNASGQKLIFRELDLDSFHNLDSMKLDDIGFFRFIFNPTEEGFYILKFEKDEYILLLLEKGEEVHVEADLQKQPFSYTVTGSPGSAILREFYIQTIQNLLKADSLRNVLLQQRESPDFYQLSLSFDTLFIKIIENQKQIQKNFIKQNPGSLASLMVLNYKFGVVPVVNMKDDFPVYQNLDSMLSKKYPLNKHVVFHHQRVVEHELQEKEKQTQKK